MERLVPTVTGFVLKFVVHGWLLLLPSHEMSLARSIGFLFI